MRLELTCEGLRVNLANHCTTRSVFIHCIESLNELVIKYLTTIITTTITVVVRVVTET